MKKRFCALLLAGTMLWGLTACSADDSPELLTGTGESQGYGGPIRVEVAVSADKSKIEDLQVMKSSETDGIGSRAIQVLAEAILKDQTIHLDAISGATLSSQGFLHAVEEAINAAGVDETLFQTVVSKPKEEQVLDVDVVVVGAGGAGMVAGVTAARAGKKVVILEKAAISGGNSARSTGGMNAAKTEWQDDNGWAGAAGLERTLSIATSTYPQLKSLADTVQREYSLWQNLGSEGCFDSPSLFILDTMIGGKCLNDIDLVTTLAENSSSAVDWLDSIGASLHSVSFFGGASVNRIHRPVDTKGKVLPVGSYLAPILEQACIDNGVEILFETPVTQILMDNGTAVGVKAEGCTVNAKSVILATGGFGADLEQVTKLNPELTGYVTTNIPGATGDGIRMAQAVGAAAVDMAAIQVHPTVEKKTSTLIAEGLREDGAILVNAEGLRFCDETGAWDAVSAAELAQTGGSAWLIVDQRMADTSSAIAGYISKGFAVQGENYEALAKAMAVPEDTFAQTMETWNTSVVSRRDEAFGRTSFSWALDVAPFYAIQVVPGIHHTMGGLKINPSAEVLDAQDASIPGLFAAGEVTGGIHGADRLGGNAIADFVVFGQIAGENAAAYGS